MASLLRDLKYAIRSLRKNPGLSVVAVLALTFGIGLTTTMFSIVYGAMLRGLPLPDGGRVVEVYRVHLARDRGKMDMPVAEYYDYREQQKSFSVMAAYNTGTMNVSGAGLPERYTGAWTTASFFDVIRATPQLGRALLPGEDTPQGAKVAVISHSLWQRRYAGDPKVLGQTLRVNGQPFTIVGVMPEGYRYPDVSDIWLPLQDDPLAGKRDEQRYVTVAALLKPGVSVDAASVDVAGIAKGLAVRYKDSDEGIGAQVMEYVKAEIGPDPEKLLYAMLGAVFFVLLIACANVANLLLDRAAHRAREVGIRCALGASRAAVIRQFLAEALVLAAMGAVLGTAMAQAGIAAFNRILLDSTEAPAFIDIRLHAPVLLFTMGVALAATLFAGAVPALQSSRTDINEVLKDEVRGSSSLHMGRMSRTLVMVELALSALLLVSSGLMIRSVTKLNAMDPGFRTRNMFTARIGFPVTYTDTLMEARLYEQLRERLAGVPGVQHAALSSSVPGVGANEGSVTIEGTVYVSDNDVPRAGWLAVSTGFFETMEMRVTRGRALASSDRAGGNPVVVVNQAFADKFFPGQDPLGRRIRQGGRTSTEPWMTVVGVVPNAFTGDPQRARDAMYYAPLEQHHTPFVSMLVATAGPPMAITNAVREIMAGLNADIPVYRVYPIEKAMARSVWYIRTFGSMFMLFGAIALFLAAIGLYAVMSFSVSRRTREMGIRMALGAQGGQVVRMIFGQGAWQIAVGLLVGLGLAVLASPVVGILLYDVQPRDPAIYAGVAFVLALAGVAACLVPAVRATRVDPMVALRAE